MYKLCMTVAILVTLDPRTDDFTPWPAAAKVA
jgi:hypothetical protein